MAVFGDGEGLEDIEVECTAFSRKENVSAIASLMQPRKERMDGHGDGVDGGSTRLGLVAR